MTGTSTRPALYQILVRQPGREAVTVPVGMLPFRVGRAPGTSLCLEAPGIWLNHLRFELDPEDGLVAEVEGDALATVQDEPLRRRRLRHGDLIRLGPVTLQVLVSPPARHSLRLWEWVVWVVLGTMAVLQLVAGFGLPHD